MLKLIGIPKIEVGMRVVLPEIWHEKVTVFSKNDNYPYEFVVEDIIKDKVTKEIYYVCKQSKKENKRCVRLVFTEYAMKYLFSQEIPDSNFGFSFKEYLPIEETKILITNEKNPSEVVPGIFRAEAKLITIDNEVNVCVDLKIDFMNGKGFTSIRFYLDGKKKSFWKFLMSDDVSCMTDYEKMFRDTYIHKEFVMKSCEKLASYLEKEGATEHAKLLRERAIVHDNSKVCNETELYALSRIINDRTSLTDASAQLSPIKRDAIKLHWKNNSHHPEHFSSPIDMTRLDVMEMCCDWCARSMQYNTNLLEFVKKRQEERFHFPDWMFAEIWHYCQVLASEF